jgi:nucleoid-associated protein YgaU
MSASAMPRVAHGRSRPRWRSRTSTSWSGIAKSRLGDARRWPEIHRLNRDLVLNPNDVVPGMELVVVKR